MDQKEIGKIFYRDGYRLANEHLAGGVTADRLRNAIRALYEAIDSLLEAFLQRASTDGKPAACKNGCAFCCYQPVFAVSHEMLYLKDYVSARLSPKQEGLFTERAREKSLLTLNKGLEEQKQISHPCPFLGQSSCLIYEARPMACRIYLSSSLKSCKLNYEKHGQGRGKPELFDFPLTAGRMMNEGFVSCLRQMGLDSAELPLEQAYASLVTLDQDFQSWIG